jgi:RND family efflux transporter MFP subunit
MKQTQARAVLLAVLALTPFALAGCDSHAEKAAAAPARPVLATVVHLEPGAAVHSLPGTIRARVESDIGFRIGGKVVRRLVDNGQVVTAGQALAELDPIDLQLQLRQAQADLVAAATARQTALNELHRIETLHRGGWSTGSDYDRQRSTADEAVGKYDRALHAVELAARSVDYGTLRADAAGVVTSVSVELGQVVAAGQTVFRIAHLDEREAAVAVPEGMLDAVRRGHAQVTLWAVPGRSYPARLRELTPSADAATRTYAARFTIPDAATKEQAAEIMLGMTATVSISEDAAPVARVPLAAILDEGHGPAVWLVDPATGVLTRRPVTIDRYAGNDAVVSAGLTEGDTIVSMGVQKLDAAQHVRVVSRLPS